VNEIIIKVNKEFYDSGELHIKSEASLFVRIDEEDGSLYGTADGSDKVIFRVKKDFWYAYFSEECIPSE